MNSASSSCHPGCGCHPSQPATGALPRRDFLRLLAGTGAALSLPGVTEAMAGPFTRADFERLVPADKKLSPAWLASLTARGSRTVYRDADLAYIGMPVGGIGAGQLYLGGDGRLWHWDIFNQHIGTGAEHYAKPPKAASPVAQGFALRLHGSGGVQDRPLAAGQWRDVTFTGEYPIGFVEYADPACPVRVRLEAFSPFIPLNVEDSSLPVTVLEFTLENVGTTRIEAELAGWLENAVGLHRRKEASGLLRNRLVREPGLLALECSAADLPDAPAGGRPDIVFDDFEREGHGDWTPTGTAFGNGPVEAARMPDYQGEVGAHGRRLINSHASAPGGDIGGKDAATGRLTSRAFVIDRHYLTCLIGGGNHAGRTCLNLIVDGQVVRTATGAANNRLAPLSWDVRPWAGKTARLEIVDAESGGWGNIGVDDIVFSDRPRVATGPLAEAADFGTLSLALLTPAAVEGHGRPRPGGSDRGWTALGRPAASGLPAGLFDAGKELTNVERAWSESLVGAVGRKVRLAPGARTKITFVLAWHLPNLRLNRLPPGRHYARRFDSALAVVRHVTRHAPRLLGETRRWHATWYDSTLPYWFLDRTFLNTSILASSTCYRLGNGRFYAWEGVGCCEGTCGHVWQYAHAVARLFPSLERETREQVDFGLALQPDGAIHFRGEFNDIPAIDAQAGTILRVLREHQMTGDERWLKALWPRVRRATEWLIAKDGDGDGLITGNQHNTLDTDWFGPVAWLSGLYLAALEAAAVMAGIAGDNAFAARCREIAAAGRRNLVGRLFVDGYFVNQVDPAHLDAINSGTGCEIDQVMGQSWAFQVGLPRVLPEAETRAALASLWRYNFTPDVGPYREAYKPGRWYAMPGEAGLLMCTFPRAGWDYAQARGKGADWAAGYFNECMNGFEYQVAGHMLWEGMLTEGLAVTRAVHDRYHASRRNPWNEVECGDHYARSMASYGVFLAACGYAYDGPRGALAFAPRLGPDHFQAAFTAAHGWGRFEQSRSAAEMRVTLELRWGSLRLRTLTFTPAAGAAVGAVTARLGGRRAVPAQVTTQEGRAVVSFTTELHLREGETLEVRLA